ncbi:Fic family protein [Mycoplasmopsis fermentans]|uniref:Fido domain-containing protein n=2 Tax=Mycoplasmopsis fermentans TaxID=2115 RepID=C4XFF3_MYCFP|nr:Fic family protein [Mycoplasmopsis fermentans]VEU67283.1 Fic/DOC family [Mesomycoplasma conjunctivae]ADN69266.1 conserved hypothetical membrane spanning protein [Mycoplasmopsis fermentans JER]ADV34827.1 Filamentation induced by cAMP protein Fic [Mycoplasmopsis fermentans M64]VEU63728.1 Fic/DOC family [Mycoplasmopsis fermentans]BAH69875.1 hypothetical protein MBIO_0610 [Mycoplasmopsis fermentans PG18]
MKNIDYKRIFNKGIPTNIINLLTEIYEYKGRQNIYINNKNLEIQKLKKQALIDSAVYSNKIENINISKKRIKDILLENDELQNENEEDIKGYFELLNSLYNQETFELLNTNLILDLHYQLFQNSNTKMSGRFKLNDNFILETTLEGTQEIKFIPVKAFFISEYINNLCNKYNEEYKSKKINSLLLTTAFVLDFICISPFNHGNSRMSRILLNWLLSVGDIKVVQYISLEKIIFENLEKYQNVQQKSSYKWHDNLNNYYYFIEFILKIVLQAYKEFESRFTSLENKKIDVADNILKLIAQYQKVSKNELINLLPESSKRTIERKLNVLLKAKKILKINQGKNTKYTIKQH